VVREVVNVDEAKRQVIFAASGRNAGEDPYLIHYYRVGFDGTNMVELTRSPPTTRPPFRPILPILSIATHGSMSHQPLFFGKPPMAA
jgi:hypothetical protein